jgi:hypothetical protein
MDGIITITTVRTANHMGQRMWNVITAMVKDIILRKCGWEAVKYEPLKLIVACVTEQEK